MSAPAAVRRSSTRPCLVRGARPGPADFLLEGGKVQAVGGSLRAPRDADVIDAAGLWLLPGWVDIQVNDIEWLAEGPKRALEHASRIRDVAAYQAARGVTGLVLATLAAPLEEVIAYLEGMKIVLDDPASARDGVFIGALVEGTFMNPSLSGAQNPSWVLPPDPRTLDRLIDTGAVRLINIAPEASPGALDLIAHATRRGVVVGAGHAKPHAQRLREAVDAGLRYAIHLGNGPTGSSLKAFHDGGMLEECLRNDRVTASIILDGFHVHPQLARDWIARKDPSRVVLTSDAGFAKDVPRGEFEVFGIHGVLSEDGRYLRVVPREGSTAPNPLASDFGALFGSAVGMRNVFENAINLLTRDMEGVYCRRHAAMSLEGAVDAASRMCSSNPARLLGLADRGELREGFRSDALLLEIAGTAGDHTVRLQGVWTG